MPMSDLDFPYPINDQIMAIAKNIRLALFDVDGVLTDGKLVYGEQGEVVKIFHALDGHGLKMLQQAGIEVGIITARDSLALKKRMLDLGIEHCFYAVQDKLCVFNELKTKLGLSSEQCAFTGDDVIDLAVMQSCGLKFSVANGHYIVKHHADWVSPLTGGNGAVRSICDLLLTSQGNYPLALTSSQ